MIHIELTDDPRYAYDVASFLANMATSFGVDKSKTNALTFLIEAVLDMRMDQMGSPGSKLALDAYERNSEFIVSITDTGVPYSPTQNQQRIYRNSNLGRLTFEQLGIEGGQRLSFHIRQQHSYAMPEPPKRREEALEDSNVTCRRTATSTEDILEAIGCLYHAYGYGYLHQSLYHTDQFRNLIRGGKYVSLLAENEHHQVLGHVALEEHNWFSGLNEICSLVVKPIARGLGLAGKLCDTTVEIAEQEQRGNLYAMPVLHHPISQRILNKAGLVPCGLNANIMDMKRIRGHENETGKASVALCVRAVNDRRERTLYLPTECTNFVCDVLNDAGLSFVLGEPSASCERQSVVSYNLDATSRVIEVKVDVSGSDLGARMEEWTSLEGNDTYEVVTAYVNADDPQCVWGYRFFRAHGFVFTGCLPGGTKGDYLLLQQYRGIAFDRSGTVLESNYAAMLDQLDQINAS